MPLRNMWGVQFASKCYEGIAELQTPSSTACSTFRKDFQEYILRIITGKKLVFSQYVQIVGLVSSISNYDY